MSISTYLTTPNFRRPARPVPRLAPDDAAIVAPILGGQTEPGADDLVQLDRIMASRYGTSPAQPGAFGAALRAHGGRAVALAVHQAFFWDGRGPQDVMLAAESIAAEAGTWRTGPPLFPEDDLEPEASQTAEVIVTDDPVVAEPAMVEDEPLGQVAPAAQHSLAAGYDWDYADDWRGHIDAAELTEAEEDYRRRAEEMALHYARDYSLAIIPVWPMASKVACACRQGELCEAPGKHPYDTGWPETATSDPEQAARWWRKLGPGDKLIDWRPLANIGIAMKGKHFITDVDVDAGKQGDASLERLVEQGGGEAMPDTMSWQTGGGGRQSVLLAPEGVEIRNSASKIAPDIDIKAPGGYGIAPPSVSGKGEYRMLSDISPDVLPPGWLNAWLREQHRQRTEHIRSYPAGDPRQLPRDGLTKRAHAYLTAALGSGAKAVSTAKPQTRNNTLNDEAFALFAKFGRAGLLSADDIAAALSAAAQECGLESGAIYATIQSAARGGQIKDRTAELPDFLFEEPGQGDQDELIKPDSDTAILTFRVLYDLRESAGKFYARPADEGAPAVVAEIDDALGRTIAAWWEDAAVAWNKVAKERKQKQAEEMKAVKAAEAERRAAKLATMTEDEQLEYAKKEQKAAFATAPGRPAEEDEEDGYAEVHPARDKINHVLYHLEVAAARHATVELHLRATDGPGYVMVDLADETGNVVMITADGWQVCDVREVDDPPWFKRGRAMLPQVIPVQPDSVMAALKSAQGVLGLDDEAWALVLGALIGWHFPSLDRPGIWMTGPSGAGKTTRAHMAINLIDPVKKLGGRIDLRRDERNARTKAMARYVVALDNLTEISPDMSDWWCTMHTGVADEVRKLHSDNEMLSFDYKRVGLGTSLSLPVGLQPDALRRTLHVELEATETHPDKIGLWRAYEEIKSQVLGALYTVISEILANLDKALAEELPGCPEMSDYARRLKAADLAFSDLHLYDAYSAHTGDILVQRAADDPLVRLVIEAMTKLPKDELGQDKDFDDTPTALYKYLTTVASSHPMSDNYSLSKKWPADPTKMGAELTKLHGPLLRLGFDFKRSRTGKARNYQIVRVPISASDAPSDAQKAPVTLDNESSDAGF